LALQVTPLQTVSAAGRRHPADRVQHVQGPGDPAPLHPTAAGELEIALADQQVMPQVEGLVPGPSTTSAPGTDST
jgi:hypothetical protein